MFGSQWRRWRRQVIIRGLVGNLLEYAQSGGAVGVKDLGFGRAGGHDDRLVSPNGRNPQTEQDQGDREGGGERQTVTEYPSEEIPYGLLIFDHSRHVSRAGPFGTEAEPPRTSPARFIGVVIDNGCGARLSAHRCGKTEFQSGRLRRGHSMAGQRFMTTSRPAARTLSAASRSMTFKGNQTALAPTAIASSATSPAWAVRR